MSNSQIQKIGVLDHERQILESLRPTLSAESCHAEVVNAAEPALEKIPAAKKILHPLISRLSPPVSFSQA